MGRKGEMRTEITRGVRTHLRIEPPRDTAAIRPPFYLLGFSSSYDR